MDICLLGTGGTMPLPERALTSLLIRHNGRNILIDCGEGTQVMIRKSGFSLNRIDAVLITHFHADHISGLPGLLLSIGKSERKEPVKIIGCKGISNIVKSLCVIAHELPFELEFTELDNEQGVFIINELCINYLFLCHRVPCYGYSITLKRAGKFLPENAAALGIEQRYWGLLQKGETIESNGKFFTPDMVLGTPRKGLKVTYCTDTRPTPEMAGFAQNSDLFVCEGMYANDDMLEQAVTKRHMLFSEAAKIARDANVSELWLTHFSPSLKDPYEYKDFASSLFENTVIPYELQCKCLEFERK